STLLPYTTPFLSHADLAAAVSDRVLLYREYGGGILQVHAVERWLLLIRHEGPREPQRLHGDLELPDLRPAGAGRRPGVSCLHAVGHPAERTRPENPVVANRGRVICPHLGPDSLRDQALAPY